MPEQEKRLRTMCEYKGYKIYKVYKDAYINNVFALEEYDLKRKNVENTIEKLKIKLKYVMNQDLL